MSAPDLCAHELFAVEALVVRLADTGRFVLEVSVRCAECRMRFRFLGFDQKVGMAMSEAMVSPGALELRAPIEPDPHASMMLAPDSRLLQ